MIRVRLFKIGTPVGVVRFEPDRQRRMRPAGVLTDDDAAAITSELESGRIRGSVGDYQWYRQATPLCPRDPAVLCPCDRPTCEAGIGG